jgi:hypothetical protein
MMAPAADAVSKTKLRVIPLTKNTSGKILEITKNGSQRKCLLSLSHFFALLLDTQLQHNYIDRYRPTHKSISHVSEKKQTY